MTSDTATQPEARRRAAEIPVAQEPPPSGPGASAPPAAELPLMPRGVRRAQQAAVGVGMAVALLGGGLLGSGALGLPLLAALPGVQEALVIETAVALLLAGLALVAAGLTDGGSGGLYARRLRLRDAVLLRRLGRLAGVTTLILGSLSLSRAVDRMHAAAPGPEVSPTMVVTALYFVAVGTSLVFLDSDAAKESTAERPGAHPAAWLAYGAVWLGGLVLTGRLLSGPPGSALDLPLGVGLPIAAAMVALALGVLAARPHRGLAAVALSSTTGGTLMRGLLPASLLIPPLGMWILVGLAPRLGLFEYRFATALGTMAGCAIVAALAAKMARRLAATDSERQAHQLWLRRDLPELAQALRERDRTRLMLERTNHDLDEFAYAASHDLRAPLRGIANLAQWVEEDLGESVASSTRHQLNLLRGRVHRMEKLIDDILAYSRAGRSSQPPCLVVVAELVAEIIQRLSPPPRARFVSAPDLPELMTDRGQLQLVFFNLLSNTLKHARRDDLQVEIKAEQAGDFVRFTVADNGPGIAPQYHDRIWGMFQTLASRDQVEGTGMGLCTVKKLVERHGGRVGVDSAEGQGARFFFLWPRLLPPISAT